MSKDKDNTITRLKTKPMERNFALTKMGLGAGMSMATHAVGNLFRSSEDREEANRQFAGEQAQRLADELGQLKGSVMKAGQMLSLYGQYFLPKEAIDVLSGLQDNTPPVSWTLVSPQLAKSLGAARLMDLDVDPDPIAAASLGQAHRARVKSTGEEVVVKIQYPGVADAIDSDIKTLSRLLMATRLAPKQLDLSYVFNELRDMLIRECDYPMEREFTEAFEQRLADDPRFRVPKVFAQFCAHRVLTTGYEPGFSIRAPEVQALSQDRRNALGQAFVDLFIDEFFIWKMVQTDPHFGNYKIQIDANGPGKDRLVVLDFGATRVFEDDFVAHYSHIVRGGIRGNREEVMRGALDIDLMDRDVPKGVLEDFADLAELITEPFRSPTDPRANAAMYNEKGQYCFARSDLPTRVAQKMALNMLTVHFKIPPREIIFLHRRIAGVFIALAALGAEIDMSQAVSKGLVAVLGSD